MLTPLRVWYLRVRLSEPMNSARVLIVEDDRDIREGLADLFREEGYSVAVAKNGAEGLAVARANGADLVLLDLAMPVLDGAAFLARQRADRSIADIPVIVLTARQGVEIPGCEILPKPFELEDLLAAASRCIGAGTVQPAAGI